MRNVKNKTSRETKQINSSELFHVQLFYTDPRPELWNTNTVIRIRFVRAEDNFTSLDRERNVNVRTNLNTEDSTSITNAMQKHRLQLRES